MWYQHHMALMPSPPPPPAHTLSCSLRRDIVERGRTVESVLTQYLRFVKAGFESFVAPSMAFSDVIIPRAKQNVTAIELLARDIQRRCDASI
jgi:uridine kinase